MAIFRYQGLQGGVTRQGEIVATDRRAALNALTGMGITPVDLAEEAGRGGRGPRRKGSAFSLSRGIAAKEITSVTRQLATLAKAGFPLVRALGFVRRQAEKESLRGLIDQLDQDIRQGSTLSEALGKHPRQFDSLYLSMVRAGEAGGVLDTLLIRLADMREADEALRKKIKGAMTYPSFMLFAMLGALVVLFTFVVPQFAGMFREMGQTLPAPTRIMLDLGNFFQTYWWAVLGLLASPFLISRYWGDTPAGRAALDRLKLKVPLFGGMVEQLAMARVCRTLGTLLGSGVPLVRALEGCRGVADNVLISDAIGTSLKSIREGRKVGETFAATGVFPDLVCEMASLGEESGRLGEMLLQVADIYERETDQVVKALTSILEPLMILVMGGVVGLVVVAMLMPIFSMNLMGG